MRLSSFFIFRISFALQAWSSTAAFAIYGNSFSGFCQPENEVNNGVIGVPPNGLMGHFCTRRQCLLPYNIATTFLRVP